ncbi:TIGR03118 family protein [Candidatus Solirubrobacter pratensis]|uniref:TIGR03118 family protein n=1 Tax=Candidatus Solirubrobacter pratensis TaxID=1298857 RepID=UPI000420B747|nr:TIGR03118 family protein [Candidatus Solirubrobacter pratensis]
MQVLTRFARGTTAGAAIALAGLAFAGSARADSDQYVVHNLVSSSPLVPADRYDPNLVNPWGLVASATSPWWPAHNGTGTSGVYPATNVPNPLVVSVPGGPTGIVSGGVANNFPIAGGVSSFIFSTEAGTLYGWRSGTAAQLTATRAGASYKGLAIATTAGGPRLYATDFKNARVDVFDGQWQPVTPAGGFTDPSLPAGYAPYGIQTIGGRIFVTYAKQDPAGEDEIPGAGLGYVDAFDTAGTLLAHVASGGALNAPWGVAQAPAGFGAFSGDLLVANFGDGRINAFKEGPAGTFTPHGTLQSPSGGPLAIGGLWAIQFGAGNANSGPKNALFFTAGPNGETAGAFGRVDANPLAVGGTVPATLSLALGGAASFGAFTPGAGMDYTAQTTATVTSTAGDATLTYSDPGHLANGAFSLPQPLVVELSKSAWTAPVSDDTVGITFKQRIDATDALRTGTYNRTITFTLSTTNP